MFDQAAQHGFWYYNWGNTASVVGLVTSLIGIGFTIWTLITAKSAERAAIEAKNNAASLAFSNDARKAERHTKDIIIHLEARNYAEARLCSSFLLEMVGELNERWPRGQPGELRTVLLAAKNDCEQNDKLIRRINIEEIESPSPREIERIVQRANSIYAAIVRIRIATSPE